jgi:hypothetical protein
VPAYVLYTYVLGQIRETEACLYRLVYRGLAAVACRPRTMDSATASEAG